MKKLINDPRAVVREMLEGQVALYPGQALLEGEMVVLRADLPARAARPVAVLSGGGSGHEPAHAGYVGPGLLTAAIAGDVFTSPSVDAIVAAIRAAAGPAGAVLVVKNYTGDRLNFALAAELARTEGIPCEIVVVADDVALRDTVSPEQRRGIAGTVLIHKIAGAAAASGATLADVAAQARAAAADLGSMGVGLGACTVPAAGQPGFELGADEIELGLGIHGEKGVARSAMRGADELVDSLLGVIVNDRALVAGDQVALLVNGLGGTPPMELAIVARQALRHLRAKNLVVERAWCGNYLTALEMAGCSLSVLKLDTARLALLDREADAPAWMAGARVPTVPHTIAAPAGAPSPAANAAPGPLAPVLRRVVLAIAAALEVAEPELTLLDAQAGDGDLGASMARGADAIRALPDRAYADPATLLDTMGQALRRAIAGSSGPFYATALLRAARRLDGLATPTPADWAAAFEAGVASIREIGGAAPGDRTMVDALQPAADRLRQGGPDAVAQAVTAARAGADATATMAPKLGRAAYLGARAIGASDGGAVAVSLWLRAIADAVKS